MRKFSMVLLLVLSTSIVAPKQAKAEAATAVVLIGTAALGWAVGNILDEVVDAIKSWFNDDDESSLEKQKKEFEKYSRMDIPRRDPTDMKIQKQAAQVTNALCAKQIDELTKITKSRKEEKKKNEAYMKFNNVCSSEDNIGRFTEENILADINDKLKTGCLRKECSYEISKYLTCKRNSINLNKLNKCKLDVDDCKKRVRKQKLCK